MNQNSCSLATTLQQTYLPLVADEKSYDSILERLTRRHGGKIPEFKIKVWARMLVSAKITGRQRNYIIFLNTKAAVSSRFFFSYPNLGANFCFYYF